MRETESACGERGLRAIRDFELLQYRGDVDLHRALRKAELAGDDLVRFTFKEQSEHLLLPRAELRRV